MKKGNLDIYELIWIIRDIAREMNCTHNGCIVGDLMIDALTFNRLNDGAIRYWHIEKSLTWVAETQGMFEKDVYMIRKENNMYNIEKIK